MKSATNIPQNVLACLNSLGKMAKHMAIITIQNLRSGQKQLRSRINVENTTTLKNSGFSVGTRFEVQYKTGFIELVISESGSNVISPKKFPKRNGDETIGERLDLRSTLIHQKFAGKEKVLAIFLEGRIVFMHVPTNQRRIDRAKKLLDAIDSGVIETASFYSGVGTLDAALHEGLGKSGLRAELKFFNDSWNQAVDCLLENNPVVTERTRSFSGGIEEFIASGTRIEGITFLHAGIPCQGASTLNVATRDLPEMHDSAGHQILNFMMAVQQLDFPPLILIENVLAWSETVSCSMLMRVLEEQGYQTQLVGDYADGQVYKGMNSCHYGDIERRVRMALIAYPDGIDLSFASMHKSGPSTKSVGDIRIPEHLVPAAE